MHSSTFISPKKCDSGLCLFFSYDLCIIELTFFVCKYNLQRNRCCLIEMRLPADTNFTMRNQIIWQNADEMRRPAEACQSDLREVCRWVPVLLLQFASLLWQGWRAAGVYSYTRTALLAVWCKNYEFGRHQRQNGTAEALPTCFFFIVANIMLWQ